MSNSNKVYKSLRNNEHTLKKYHRDDVSLRKDSVLHFQIGIIACLLVAFVLFEMKFEKYDEKDYVYASYSTELVEAPYENFKIYHKPKQEVQLEAKKKVLLSNNLKEVDNDFDVNKVIDTVTINIGTNPDRTFDSGLIEVPDIEETPDVHFILIEQVPIYPGCEIEKTNDDKRKCMSKKIEILVQKKFDIELASELGLSGKQKIRTEFKIDKTGRVVDVKISAPHPELKKEAQRIIDKIPKMTPGKQRDKNVGVIYSLPITFKVQK